MMDKKVALVGVPMDLGGGRRGVDMGPSAIRIAGLEEGVLALGLAFVDRGNVPVKEPSYSQGRLRSPIPSRTASGNGRPKVSAAATPTTSASAGSRIVMKTPLSTAFRISDSPRPPPANSPRTTQNASPRRRHATNPSKVRTPNNNAARMLTPIKTVGVAAREVL